MDKSEVGKGTIYLYVENVIAMFLGYAFWFILSKLTTPEIIGISSSLTSFAAIFASIASFGIPIGVQRLLGNMYFERKFEEIKVLVNASMLILSTGIIICSLLIFVTRDWLYSSVDLGLIIMSIVLVASTDISVLFRYIIIASLKTKKLLAVSIYSSLGKLALAIILVLMGTGALGVMMGYVFTPILTSIFLAFTIITILKKSSNKPTIEFRVYFKKLFSASIASWIPLLIDTIGSQLGTIAVFGIQGADHAGFYFIPFQICTGIFAVIWALESDYLSEIEFNGKN